MMILRLLGTLDLMGDFERPDAARLLTKSKPTALLVYLLLARPDTWCRRDELTALFWPESGQQRARSALSQTIYQIRQHLGPRAIEARGSEDVRVAPGVLGCDVLELLHDLAAGDTARALDQYTGDLLPAFHLPDAGPFDDWLERERAALRRTVVGAALRLASGAHEPSVKRRWCVWAADMDVLDAETVARAMTELGGIGAYDAALAIYARHRDALRRELELDPSDAVVALADGMRGKSPPLVDRSPQPEREVATRVVRAGQSTRPGRQPRRVRRLGLALMVIAAAVAIVSVGLRASHSGGLGALDPTRVAVLPFTYHGSNDDDRWLARALPGALMPLLDGTAGMRAVGVQRMSAALATRGATWTSDLDVDEVMAVARAAGAGRYLTATVISDGAHRRVSAGLHAAASGKELAHVQFPLDSLDVNSALDRLVAELLIQVTGERRRAAELLTYSVPALRHYVDGTIARREQRHLDALRQFQRALELDSTFALAALAYREASMWLPDGTPYRVALEEADTILRRFPNRLSVADRAVANALLDTQRLDQDGRAVLRGLRRATIVAPDRPMTWMLLGDFLLHDGRMLGLPDHLALAAAAFDSVVALGAPIPEAERHQLEMRFAQGDRPFAREYLATHPRDSRAFSHLWWVAASLVGNTATLGTFDRTLAREPRQTWRLMVLWSERALTGFAQADRAARLLTRASRLDDFVADSFRYALSMYALNRGRPRRALAKPLRRLNASITMPDAVRNLAMAVGAPAGWLDREQAARVVEAEIDSYGGDARLLAACNLGLWEAAWGDRMKARRLAASMVHWQRHGSIRVQAYAVACPRVIYAALDTSADLAGLRQVADYLGDEPAGVFRHDLTRWNLYVADRLATRGRPALALPLTTRLGVLVEESAWLTPALLREAELSLATGDSVRAARTLGRAAHRPAAHRD